MCFGGILGFYADLRREYFWGNLRLDSFEVLFEVPRRCIEEGGLLVFLGEFMGFTALWCGLGWA
jgi:hypothetical protein